MKYLIPYKKSGGVVVDWDFTNPIHCLPWHEDDRGYARTVIRYGLNKTVKMHRMLLNYPEHVDHINGRCNDNRMSNLRIVTHRENHHNRKEHRDGHLLGTSYDKERNKWKAQYWNGSKNKIIGRYDTQIEAHLAYKMYTRGL